MEQPCNDLAEGMNLSRWRRKDLLECIKWLGDELDMANRRRAALRSRVLEAAVMDVSK
jgi:hypothetical protein